MPRTACSSGVEGIVQLAAQAAHRHVDDVGVAVEIHVPDLLGQRGARQHLALAAQQQHEEVEFLGGQVQAAAVALGAASGQVQFQAGQAQDRRLLRAATAQQRLHPREEFGKAKGLTR